MKIRIFVLCGLLALFSSSGMAVEPEWLTKMKQVRLLSDARNDVFRIFGKEVNDNSEIKLSASFELEDGQVFVVFASGLCLATADSDGKPIGWKVPVGTVTSISYTPYKPIKPKKLPFDLARFKKDRIEDSVSAYFYDDPEQGINLTVNSKGKIESIGFYPPSKFDYLLCSK